MGPEEPGAEEACSPPRRIEPPFRRPRPAGSSRASALETQPRPAAAVRGPGEPSRGVSRFFSRTAPAAELRAENAALGDKLADQLARPKDAAKPKATTAADAPAPAAVRETEEASHGPPAVSEGKLPYKPYKPYSPKT